MSEQAEVVGEQKPELVERIEKYFTSQDKMHLKDGLIDMAQEVVSLSDRLKKIEEFIK
ncbi:hypothetical protein [Undibacterium curvum]|uniref:Uncharacterized protein n=1 Tax=Undibacterium curvum TaxID=2762294 RepID=A0ABR7A0D1_9BURK|nr:hypothetical protein [Undibacterium curvum]MBC3930370.1 hypothetical protein [Undibacterium curvum]